MKIQFLYHPENDKFIADKIIKAVQLSQLHSLEGLRIGNINSFEGPVLKAIKECDILILLVGTTFSKITPFMWFNALQDKKAILGIDIHTINDEWGKDRKKGGVFSTEGTTENDEIVKLFDIHELPVDENGIKYIKNNIDRWIKDAFFHVDSHYGIK